MICWQTWSQLEWHVQNRRRRWMALFGAWVGIWDPGLQRTYATQSFQTCNSRPHRSTGRQHLFPSCIRGQSRTETHWRKSGSRSPSEALAMPQRLWTRSKHATRQNAGLLSNRNIIVGSTCVTRQQMRNHSCSKIIPALSLKLFWPKQQHIAKSGTNDIWDPFYFAGIRSSHALDEPFEHKKMPKCAKWWRSGWSKSGPSAHDHTSHHAKRTLYHWATPPVVIQ